MVAPPKSGRIRRNNGGRCSPWQERRKEEEEEKTKKKKKFFFVSLEVTKIEKVTLNLLLFELLPLTFGIHGEKISWQENHGLKKNCSKKEEKEKRKKKKEKSM